MSRTRVMSCGGEVGRRQQVLVHLRSHHLLGGPSTTTPSEPSVVRPARPDRLAEGGGQVLANVVDPQGQPAVATVDQHGQLDGPRPAEVGQGVEGGPDRPPSVEDVVDAGRRPVPARSIGSSVSWWPGAAGCRCRRGTWRRQGARRDLPPSISPAWPPPAPARGTPASVDADHHQPCRCPCSARRSRARSGPAPALDVGGVQHRRHPDINNAPAHRAWRRPDSDSISSWLPSRPHRTGP